MVIKKSQIVGFFKYLFLIIVCLFSVFPFYWMLAASTKKSIDIIKGNVFFGDYLIGNWNTLINTVNLGRAMWNSLRNSAIGTILSVLICAFAGYGFQIYKDRKKNFLMGILLLSMMIPFASIVVPLFRIFSSLGLMGTTAGFIIPQISTAFLIFFFRQSTMSFPIDTIHAARVDGLSEFGIFFKIYMPIMAPTFAAATIVTFMNFWNSYLWPLVIMQSQRSQTMPLLVSGLTAGYTTDYGILMLAVTICTIPTLVLFFTQQKRFISGILGSVK